MPRILSDFRRFLSSWNMPIHLLLSRLMNRPQIFTYACSHIIYQAQYVAHAKSIIRVNDKLLILSLYNVCPRSSLNPHLSQSHIAIAHAAPWLSAELCFLRGGDVSFPHTATGFLIETTPDFSYPP